MSTEIRELHDFEDLETARAWRQHLAEAGIEAVITSDWPLDHFGRGDIALRVPPGRWSDADEFLSGVLSKVLHTVNGIRARAGRALGRSGRTGIFGIGHRR